MRAALREARRSLGLTSPNPAVGAVLVNGGKVLARGHHRKAGAPHAEIECLRNFKKAVPHNAILYVTLEPCSTSGRTGPCTNAIIEAGVRRLVIVVRAVPAARVRHLAIVVPADRVVLVHRARRCVRVVRPRWAPLSASSATRS